MDFLAQFVKNLYTSEKCGSFCTGLIWSLNTFFIFPSGFPGMSGTRVDLLQSLETVAALDSLPLPDHAPAIEAEAVAIDYQVD